MLSIPLTVYLIGLALVLRSAFRHAGEAGQPGAGRLALKRGIAWTGIWALLFLLYMLVMSLGSFGM
jgi:DMSO/TMAO reductase YedYZ heme-binding membrane subunit